MIFEIDVDAAIVPEESLGGIPLGCAVDLIDDPVFRRSRPGSAAEVIAPYHVWYKLADGRVGIFVDVRTGLVFRISAYSGYRGALFGIGVGMIVREAISRNPEIYYDEAHGLLLYRSKGGVELEITGDDPSLDEALEQRIIAITVWRADLVLQASKRPTTSHEHE